MTFPRSKLTVRKICFLGLKVLPVNENNFTVSNICETKIAYNIGPSIEPCTVPSNRYKSYELLPFMLTKYDLCVNHLAINPTTSLGRPPILILLSSSGTLIISKVALKSRLETKM